ncbi:MAG: glycosyltransferase family 9 protein [Bacteroidota bacterium]
MEFAIPSCKHFTGYKPCFPGTNCLEECIQHKPLGTRILLINLDAMGNVLVTTSILPALKRKYPISDISWVTLKISAPLLQNNPFIDRVYTWDPESILILEGQEFDIVMNVDKSRRSGAFAVRVNARERLGFGMNGQGVIIPLNPEAEENYRLGLDDDLKFHVNQKTVGQLECEEFRLPYNRDEYVLHLTEEEEEFCRSYKDDLLIKPGQVVVGFNTGCSELYPNKKLTVEQHVVLLERLAKEDDLTLVLLGGPEDTVRNAEIHRRLGARVINTPTTEGVRRGICYENICDLVVTGDSFGMHLAIGLKKHVIAWFGLSCWTEIDLYDRGAKLVPEGLACAPCWRKACPYNLECIAMVDLDRIVAEVCNFRDGRKQEWENESTGARGL